MNDLYGKLFVLCIYSYHSLQASSEGQCSELQAQLKITQFEKERVSIAHHETLTQLKHCQLDREKLQKKVKKKLGTLLYA